MYKLSKVHVVANALSRILDIIEPISVLDQTIDASLFYTKLEWLKDVKEILRIGKIEGMLLIQKKQRLIRRAEPILYIVGHQYPTISGQLCTKMCMTIANLMLHVKEHEDWQLKVL